MRAFRHIIILCLAAGALQLRGQIISHFDWNSNPVTNAVVGPNASSAGATATSSPGGAGGTNGLNPGAPSPASDINLNIPNTGSVLNVPDMDVSIDYRRNESTASMLRRGSFSFHNGSAAANFQVTFRVNNGSGATVVTSTAYPIPQDATFRNYRFTYDRCNGVGTMYVNNTVVWASPTPTANQDLYWVGDGNIVIGQDMDGANNNIPNLDNFILQRYPCGGLPIELSSFSGSSEGSRNRLKWSTSTEKNNDFFTVERSTDGSHWTDIAVTDGAGTSTSHREYEAFDNAPEQLINYYRLRQTDFDRTEKRFRIISIDNSSGQRSNSQLKYIDLLGREVTENCPGVIFVLHPDGTVIKRTND